MRERALVGVLCRAVGVVEDLGPAAVMALDGGRLPQFVVEPLNSDHGSVDQLAETVRALLDAKAC